MAEVLYKVLELSPYELDDPDINIPHQANLRVVDGLIKKLGVPEEKVCRVVRSVGNTSGASVAISLDLAIRITADGPKLNPGDLGGLTADLFRFPDRVEKNS
jgi:3-oxoacyl-[acyl-carrier-protein] synthase-3